MLCGIAFWLSGRVVALHMDNSTTKAYQCNQGGIVSPFLSRVACWILSLTTSKVLLLFQHTILPILMWRLIICHGVSCFQSCIFFLTLSKWLFIFEIYQRWISWHSLVPFIASIITPWKSTSLWGPWGWIPLTILGSIR